MKKDFFLLFIGLTASIQAQRFDWLRQVTYATPTNTEISGAYDMVRDASGNLYTVSLYTMEIVVGEATVTHEGSYNNGNLILVKWSPDGEVLAYRKLYAQTGLTPYHLAYDTVNDQLLLTTSVSGQPLVIPDDGISLNDTDAATQFLRFDNDLHYVSHIPKFYTYAFPVASHEGDTYFAHGYTSSVTRADAENQVQWTVTQSGSSNYAIYNISVSPNGTVFVCGRANGNVTVNLGGFPVTSGIGDNDQLIVYKISPDGVVLDGRLLTNTTPIFFGDIPIVADAADNLFLMAGYNENGLQIDGFPLTDPNTNGNDVFVLRLNADLDAEWLTEFHHPAGNMKSNAIALSETGALFAGGSYGGVGNFGGVPLPASSGSTGFGVKMDPADGTVQWARHMGTLSFSSWVHGIVP